MSPDQAVQKLRNEGFVSFERTWTLGHSIAAGIHSHDPAPQNHLLYLYPSGDQWRLIDFSHPAVNDVACQTLDEAVDKAIASLKAKNSGTNFATT